MTASPPTGDPARPSRRGPWRPRIARDAYGGLLVIVLATVVGMGLGAGFAPLTILLQSSMLVFALATAGAPRPLRALAIAFGVAGVILAFLHAASHDRVLAVTGSLIGMVLALAAAVTILRRVGHYLRVSAATVYAVLSVYLLAGIAFAYLYQAVGAAAGPFFADRTGADAADFLYFSFITLTTVGYGDFVPAGRLGEVLAAVEAVTGQLYLVSVVGLVVGNLSRPRA